MPRTLQPDQQLFGVTLALCLIGAVMVFSASAVTASEQFGTGYIFLLRQMICVVLGIAGMFWLMNVDYRKLRQPRVIFTGLAVTFVLLVGVFFLDRSHQTHRWFRMGPFSFQPSEMAKLAVIVYLAWFLELRARCPEIFGVNDPLHTLAPAMGATSAAGGAGGERAGHGHGLHDPADRDCHAVRRRPFAEISSAARCWPPFP